MNAHSPMNDLDKLIRQLEGADYYDETEPEPRLPLSWLLYGWPAFTALILGASIALAVWLG
jgi:hypothetical protein